MKSTTMFLAAAAMTGLIAGSANRAQASTVPQSSSQSIKKSLTGNAKAGVKAFAADDKGKHDCKGKNECKGQGGCKAGDNGCKGKNSCKGHGGCKTNEEPKKDKVEVKKPGEAKWVPTGPRSPGEKVMAVTCPDGKSTPAIVLPSGG